MADPLFEEFEEGTNDLAGEWTISSAGLDYIANWARFQLELHRMAPEVFGETNDSRDDELAEDAKLAYLVWFLVREAYESRGREQVGVEQGELFPSDWDDDE